MPLTHSMATRLGKKLTDVRKDGSLWWLRPDGKTQVTIEYLQKADGSVEPLKIHTVVISTQHAEPLKAAYQGVCWLQWSRDDSTKHGRYEQTHRGGSGQGDPQGNYLEERQTCPDTFRRSHTLAHQPFGKVHHQW